MSEQEEDFAAMFEASVKARRFDRGQTIEGTIVAFGPKVAFVNVGGKSEAADRPRGAEGRRRRRRGRRSAIASRRWSSRPAAASCSRARACATPRRSASSRTRSSAGLAVEGKVEKAVKGGYEVRIARERAFCPLSQIDIVRTADPAVHEGQALRVPHHRVQGRREEHRRLPAQAPRGAAARQRRGRPQVDRARRGAHRPGRVGARLRRLRRSWRRHPGPAARLRDGLVARHHTPARSSRPATRSP